MFCFDCSLNSEAIAAASISSKYVSTRNKVDEISLAAYIANVSFDVFEGKTA